MALTRARLLACLRARLDEARSRWLDAALTTSTGTLAALLTVYTGASRRMGSEPLEPSGGDGDLDGWTLEDAARAVLLLHRADASPSPEAFEADALACYEQGDSREQQSWLRAVRVLPLPGRFLPVVIDACRTNILPLFSAVACDNPYPAQYFPEANFNQLVMKALFNNVPLTRVTGLVGRLNPELARMATDFAAERRAAGRVVPSDISLVTGPGLTPQGQS